MLDCRLGAIECGGDFLPTILVHFSSAGDFLFGQEEMAGSGQGYQSEDVKGRINFEHGGFGYEAQQS